MKLDHSIVDQVFVDLTGADFSDENAKIAELEAGIDEARTAQERGRARIAEIRDELNANHLNPVDEPNGRRVAQALLDSAHAAEAAEVARTREQLETERDALTAGIKVLADDIFKSEAAIARIREQANSRLIAIVRPLTEHLNEVTCQAAAMLRDTFVATRAVNVAIKGAGDRSLAFAGEMLNAATTHDHFRPRGEWSVPREIQDLLTPLAGKGSAVRPALISMVKV